MPDKGGRKVRRRTRSPKQGKDVRARAASPSEDEEGPQNKKEGVDPTRSDNVADNKSIDEPLTKTGSKVGMANSESANAAKCQDCHGTVSLV